MQSVLERYIRCWNDVFALARRPAAFLPFALVALLKSGLLLAMYFFWHPLVAGFMAPALRVLGGEEVLHFPTHARSLPILFQTSEIVLIALFGFAAAVWASSLMADSLEGKKRPLGAYAGHIAVLTPSIVVMALVFAGGTIGLPMALSWAAGELEGRPMIHLALLAGALGTAVLLRILLAYSPYFVRTAKGVGFGAIRKSVAFAREHFALTMLIVATAMVPEKLLEYVASYTSVFLENSRPEWIPALLLFKSVIEVFTWFFWVGAVTSKATDRTSS